MTRMAGAMFLVALALGGGCNSSTPEDAAGTYSGNIVDGESSCPGDWTVGDTAQVTVDLTQSGSAATVDVTGASGLFLQVALGASEFNGSVSGASLSATLLGTVEESQGSCKYTWKAVLGATLDANALQGTVTYTPQTNGDADCTSMSIQSCTRTQTFSVVRAPQ